MDDAGLGPQRDGDGWVVDPSGRHQLRWVQAGRPTAHVRDGDVEGIDAYDGPPVLLGSQPAAAWPPPPPALLPPPPPPPPGPRAHRSRRRWPRAVAALAAVGLLAGAVGWAVTDERGDDTGTPAPDRGDDRRPTTSAPDRGPSREDELVTAGWDRRVAPYAVFVEDERELEFRAVVQVEFLADEAFVAAAREADADEGPTDEGDELDVRTVEAYRALSVLHGHVDLAAAGEALVDEGVLGFYDPEDQGIRVRGDELTAEVAATLVHELVHALQDQHFDLEAMQDAATTSGQALGVDALVEGDATRIESEWRADNGDELEEEAADDDDPPLELGDVTGTVGLDFLTQVPYSFGFGLTATLAANGDEPSVDLAFADPPTSEEQVVFPQAYRDGIEPVAVPVPALGQGEVEVVLYEPDDPLAASRDLGALTWYVAVAGRLDHRSAWDVARAWAGDAAVVFRAAERTCVRASLAADDPARLTRLGDVLQAWVAAAPAASGSVLRQDQLVTVTTCDPGPDGAAEPAGFAASLEALVYTSLGFLAGDDDDASPELRVCLADRAMATLSAEDLVRLGTGQPSRQQMADLRAACRGAGD